MKVGGIYISKLGVKSSHIAGKTIKSSQYADYVDSYKVLKDAKKEALSIINDAKKSYEEEKKRGYRDGLEESRSYQSEKMVDVATTTIDYFASIEGKLINIVMSAVKKIIGSVDPAELTAGLIRAALKKVSNESKILLKVPYDQSQAISEKLVDIKSDMPDVGYLEVVPDEQMTEGTCRLETDMGSVDSSVENHIKLLEKILEKRFGRKNLGDYAIKEGKDGEP